MNISTFNTVSLKAPVFRAARTGDLAKLRILFEQGKVSPLDCDNSGVSLLAVSNFVYDRDSLLTRNIG